MSSALGHRLRSVRGAVGYTQAQMAELLGVTANAYQRIESGKQRHQASTLEHIDAAILAGIADGQLPGVIWTPGLAAQLDGGDLNAVILQALSDLNEQLAQVRQHLSDLDAFTERVVRTLLVAQRQQQERAQEQAGASDRPPTQFLN